jgi:hypothetical protein
LSALLVAVLATPVSAVAQANVPANLVVGDGEIAIKAGTDKQIYVAATEGSRVVTITVDPAAVDEFVSESNVLLRLGTRRIPSDVSDHPVLQERTTGRAISLSRRVELASDNSKELTYHFYVSDERLNGFVIVAEPEEAKSVVEALHHAATDVDVPPVDSLPPHPERPLGIPLPDN